MVQIKLVIGMNVFAVDILNSTSGAGASLVSHRIHKPVPNSIFRALLSMLRE